MTRKLHDRIVSTTRRDVLRVATGTGVYLLADPLVFGASDFWSKKPPADWSSEEINQLKTKSPWAKKVRGEISGGGLGAGGAGGGGGRGGNINAAANPGRGGGGMNGVADDTANTGVQPGPEVVIRWESAKPLLSATKSQLPPALENSYVISVTGLPPQMIRLGLAPAGGRGREATPAPAQDPAEREKADMDKIRSEITLSVKGHDPVIPEAMLQTNDTQTFLFGFPKQNLPLTVSDKEIVFTMKLGVLTIRTKFETKEMMFDGQLAV